MEEKNTLKTHKDIISKQTTHKLIMMALLGNSPPRPSKKYKKRNDQITVEKNCFGILLSRNKTHVAG